MTLRTRLTAAFLVVVLLPVLIGAILVGRVVPDARNRQQSDRLAVARNSVIVAAQDLCRVARSSAETLAISSQGGARKGVVATHVQRGLADAAALSAPGGAITASAGQVPSGVTLGAPGRCVAATAAGSSVVGVGVAVSRPGGASAGRAWAGFRVDAATVRRWGTVTGTDVTITSRGVPVVSTLPRQAAAAVARAKPQAGTRTLGDRLVVVTQSTDQQPLTFVVSGARYNPAGLYPVLATVAVLALLLCLVIASRLAREVSRPLAEVGEAAEQVAAGNLETRIPVRRRDEVGRLAESFNTMTAELRSYVDALRASRDQLRRNLDLLGDTLSSTHDLNRILSVVLDTAMTASAAQSAAIYLTGSNDLYCKAVRGLDVEQEPEDRLALRRVLPGQGIVGWVAESAEPIRGRRGDGGPRPAPGEPDAATYIAVPFKSSGRMLGVLALYDRLGSDEFDDGDLDTIRTFASQAAVAVDNVQLHQEAQRLSLTDGLTGLWNYRYFQMSFSREIERAARFARPLALLMLDLDRFKEVNDTHGHPRGDAVLVELARRISGTIREVDVLARYGGEEMVLVLPETDIEGARHAADRICEMIRHEAVDAGAADEVPVTVSIGVAVFPEHGTTVASLVDRADDALYAAKSAGRDTWRMAGDALPV